MSLGRCARVLVSGAFVVSVTGCGGGSGRVPERAARPAATTQLSADISSEGVRISPSRVGGGQVRIVIANDTDRAIRPVLVRAGGGSAPARTDGVIAPGAVSAIVADVRRGRWRLRAGSDIPPRVARGRAVPAELGRRPPPPVTWSA